MKRPESSSVVVGALLSALCLCPASSWRAPWVTRSGAPAKIAASGARCKCNIKWGSQCSCFPHHCCSTYVQEFCCQRSGEEGYAPIALLPSCGNAEMFCSFGVEFFESPFPSDSQMHFKPLYLHRLRGLYRRMLKRSLFKHPSPPVPRQMMDASTSALQHAPLLAAFSSTSFGAKYLQVVCQVHTSISHISYFPHCFTTEVQAVELFLQTTQAS